jgi:hypothetical protein
MDAGVISTGIDTFVNHKSNNNTNLNRLSSLVERSLDCHGTIAFAGETGDAKKG